MIGMSVLVICLLATTSKVCYLLAFIISILEIVYNLKHLND